MATLINYRCLCKLEETIPRIMWSGITLEEKAAIKRFLFDFHCVFLIFYCALLSLMSKNPLEYPTIRCNVLRVRH